MRIVIRLLLVSVLAAGAAIGVVSGGASAGGWAVTTLDAVPSPAPGAPTPVGFTILQHGVTPVALTDVSIEIVDSGGLSTSFAARPDGPTGHYVADVVFPAAGEYTWSVHPGWFEEQSLGTIAVASAPSAAADGGPPSWLAPALAVLAAMLALGAVADLLGVRRRSPRAVA